MDKKNIKSEGSDLRLAIGMLLCGFAFMEGRVLNVYSAVGKTIFMLIFCCSVLLYLKSQNISQSRRSVMVLVPIVILSASFIFFSGKTEHFITMTALVPMYLYWIASSCGETIDSKLSVYVLGDVIKQGFVTPFINFDTCPVTLTERSKGKGSRDILMISIGIVVAIPLMIKAIMLLAEADSSFAEMIENIAEKLSWNWLRYVGEFILGIPIAFYLFGLIYGNIKGKKKDDLNKQSLRKTAKSMAKVPPIIASTVLVGLNLVYILFLALQIKHLLTGLPKDLTYAEFARQGFFNLCKVAMLNLFVVIAVRIFRKQKGKGTRFTKYQICIMSILTIGISVTALTKMIMYINVYGLTQKRVYTSVFMVFLIIVFGVVGIRQFVKFNIWQVIYISGVIILIVFNYVEIDRTIAKYNIARYEKGTLEMMDMNLVTRLGDGALPEIYSVWKKERNIDMAELLRNSRGDYAWYGWSLERARANEVRDDYYRNYYNEEVSK